MLRTSRLLLRAMAQADAALYCGLYGDARVMRCVGDVLAEGRARRAFATALAECAASPPRAHYWTIAVADVPATFGLVALQRDQPGGSSAELGVLLQADAHGRGYGAETIAAVARHAFADLGLSRLWTRHRSDHDAARRLMCRLGFSASGREGEGAAWPVRWQLLGPALAAAAARG